MKCEECSMRYVCDTILGGKDKCVYEYKLELRADGTGPLIEWKVENGTGQIDTERT